MSTIDTSKSPVQSREALTAPSADIAKFKQERAAETALASSIQAASQIDGDAFSRFDEKVQSGARINPVSFTATA